MATKRAKATEKKSSPKRGAEKSAEAPPSAPTGHAHARGGDPVGQTSLRAIKAARIAQIEQLMASGAWRTGETGPRLAAEWRIHPKTVETYSAEASRRIKAEFNPDERRKLKALWLAKVNEAQRVAFEARDGNALRGALDLEARALGYYDPDRVDLSGTVDVSAKSALERKLDELAKRLSGAGPAQPS